MFDVVTATFQEFGITIKSQHNRDGESAWSGRCPFENAGHDRFTVFGKGNYYCRVCGAKGWLGTAPKMSEDDFAKVREQLKLEEIQRHQERMNALERWKREDHESECLAWQKNGHGDYWTLEGVPRWVVEKYHFGYCESRRIKTENGYSELAAYTMPIYTPSGSLINIQYRLENPPVGVGKYRQEPDIPAAPWFDCDDYEHQAIFVEGMKKAAIVFDFIGKSCQVVGFPSNLPSKSLLEQCQNFSKIFLVWDPNSDRQIQRMAQLLPDKIWAVTMPMKIDDCIVRYSLGQKVLREYFRLAEMVNEQ